jgi:D-alanyl-D-alanine carboxypeptidase (penicillin-binding protein 5/6)
MASTTKIMTAVVVRENTDLEEQVTISTTAAKTGGAGIPLKAGQTLPVRQLLEAILVRSANNGAVALAEHVGGTVDGFVELMNRKAEELGLTHTRFANPHGLDAPGHYTSAADLALLAEYAMADPVFAEMVAMPELTVTAAGGLTLTYPASNLLIHEYEGATGVKTGWTNKAGYCLVASAERGGVELVAVVMGTRDEMDRFRQARALLDWGFAHYAFSEVSSANATAGVVPVSDYLDVTVAAVVAETTSVPIFDLQGEVTSRVDVLSEIEAPVTRGQRLGTLTVVQGDRLLTQVPIVAGADVAEPGFWERLGIGVLRAWRGVFGGQRQAEAVLLM